jgi:hypothetical protein
MSTKVAPESGHSGWATTQAQPNFGDPFCSCERLRYAFRQRLFQPKRALRTLGELHDLPVDWEAERQDAGSAWIRTPIDASTMNGRRVQSWCVIRYAEATNRVTGGSDFKIGRAPFLQEK